MRRRAFETVAFARAELASALSRQRAARRERVKAVVADERKAVGFTPDVLRGSGGDARSAADARAAVDEELNARADALAARLDAAVQRAENSRGFARCLRATSSRLYEAWGSAVLAILHTLLGVPTDCDESTASLSSRATDFSGGEREARSRADTTF